MKSIIFALIGIVLYSVLNTIIEVKLKQYSTVSLLIGFYIVLLPMAVGLYIYQKFMGQTVLVPSGTAFWILAAVAAMFFIADFFWIGAYTSGGNVVVVTILLVLMPVIGALMKFVWVNEAPTSYHYASFVCAALAIILIALGNSKKPAEIEIERQTEVQIVPTK